eukprot:654540-Rhodomonas_salina.2
MRREGEAKGTTRACIAPLVSAHRHLPLAKQARRTITARYLAGRDCCRPHADDWQGVSRGILLESGKGKPERGGEGRFQREWRASCDDTRQGERGHASEIRARQGAEVEARCGGVLSEKDSAETCASRPWHADPFFAFRASSWGSWVRWDTAYCASFH